MNSGTLCSFHLYLHCRLFQFRYKTTFNIICQTKYFTGRSLSSPSSAFLNSTIEPHDRLIIFFLHKKRVKNCSFFESYLLYYAKGLKKIFFFQVRLQVRVNWIPGYNTLVKIKNQTRRSAMLQAWRHWCSFYRYHPTKS